MKSLRIPQVNPLFPVMPVALFFLFFSLDSVAHARVICSNLFYLAPSRVITENAYKGGGWVSPYAGVPRAKLIEILKTLGPILSGAKNMNGDTTEATTAVIKQVAHVRGTGRQLYTYFTKTLKEKWPDVLKEAGMGDRTIPSRSVFAGISKEQILATIKALDPVIDVGPGNMAKDKSPKGRAVIKQITGLDANPSQLFDYVTKTLEKDWVDYLTEAELSHKYRPSVSPLDGVPREKILAAIKALDPVVDVASGSIRSDESEIGSEIIKEITGVKATPVQLYRYVTSSLNEKWLSVLSEVGLEERHRRPPNPFENVSGQQLIAVYKALDTAISVKISDIRKDRSVVGQNSIFKIANVKATPAQFYLFVTEGLDMNWATFQQGVKSGFRNPLSLVARKKIIRAIVELDKNKIKVNPGSIKKDKSKEGQAIVEKITGVSVTPSRLYAYVTKAINQKWLDWLKKGKLEHLQALQENPFSQLSLEQVVDILVKLDSQDISINGIEAQRDRSLHSEDAIYQITHTRGTLAQLYYHATSILKLDWLDVLKKGKLEHRAKKRTDGPLSETELVEAIIAISQKYNPNREALLGDDSMESGRWIESVIGRYITPAKIIYEVSGKEGDERYWDYWLAKAGLNPAEIKLRGEVPIIYLTAGMKGSLHQNYEAFARGGVIVEVNNGDKQNISFTIIDNNNPEMLMIQEEWIDALDSVTKNLTGRDREIFDGFVRYLEYEMTDGNVDLTNAGYFLRENVDPSITDLEWKALIDRIGNNKSLRDSLFGN